MDFKLAGEKIRREQVGSVPTFLSVRANKFAKWKIGLSPPQMSPLAQAKQDQTLCVHFPPPPRFQ